MNACIRSSLISSVGVIGVSALVLTAGVSQDVGGRAEQAAVALAAQTQPLAASQPQAAFPTLAVPRTLAASPKLAASQPLDLLSQQATFHVSLAVDFIVTGAQLTGRIIEVPAVLLRDIQSGTPVPAAVSRALVEFADIEFVAGRELVGFAEEWVDFQIGFIADVIAGLPPIISAGPVGQLVTATLALASQFVDDVGEFARGLIAVAETFVHAVLGPGQTQAVLESAPAVTSDDLASTSVSSPVVSRAVDTTARSTANATEEASDEGTAGRAEDSESDAPTTKHDDAPSTVTASTVKDQDATKSDLSTDTTVRDGRQSAVRDNVEQAKRSDDHKQRREGPPAHKNGHDNHDATEANSDGDED